MARKKIRPLRKMATHISRISRYHALVSSGATQAEIARAFKLSASGLVIWVARMEELGLKLPRALPKGMRELLKPTFPLTFEMSVSALPVMRRQEPVGAA